MKAYMTKNFNNSVTEVDVEGMDERWVWFAKVDGKMAARVGRHTKFTNYHASAKDAYDFLYKRLEGEVDNLKAKALNISEQLLDLKRRVEIEFIKAIKNN